ncbi:hypothetical protein, partial [Streptomyces niveiscabiei]
PSCVLDTGSVYCAGNNTLPVRVDATTGRVLWRVDPGTPIARYGAEVIGVHDGVLLLRESFENA